MCKVVLFAMELPKIGRIKVLFMKFLKKRVSLRSVVDCRRTTFFFKACSYGVMLTNLMITGFVDISAVDITSVNSSMPLLWFLEFS